MATILSKISMMKVPGSRSLTPRYGRSPILACILALLMLALLSSAADASLTGSGSVRSPEDAYYEARSLIEKTDSPSPITGTMLVETGRKLATRNRFPSFSSRIIELADIAFSGTSGLMQRESGRLLVSRLALELDTEACLAASERVRAAIGPDWDVSRSLLDHHLRTGDEDRILASIAELRKLDIRKVEADIDFYVWTEFFAKFRAGRPEWISIAKPYIHQRTTTAWGARILELVSSIDPEESGLTPAEAALATMRAAVYRKKNAEAFTTIRPFLDDLLVPGTSPVVMSDLGKAMLTAPASEADAVGASTFIASLASLEEAAERYSVTEKKAGRPTAAIVRTGWLAGFYRARLLAVWGSQEEAMKAFRVLTNTAPSPGDHDSALWYWLDIQIKLTRASATLRPEATVVPGATPPADAAASGNTAAAAAAGDIAAREMRRKIYASILDASRLWKSPAWYEDIVDPFLREIVAARDWELLFEMTEGLAPATASALAIRMRYLSGRALDSGLAGTGTARDSIAIVPNQAGEVIAETVPEAESDPGREASTRAESYFRRIMDDPAAATYYRALAAWRLGIDLDLVPSPFEKETADLVKAVADAAPETEIERFLYGFLERGLGNLAGPAILARAKDFTDERLADFAARLPAAGNVSDSVRLARVLVDRKSRKPGIADYELLYPRPWYDIIVSLLWGSEIPEPVFYGLIRSESLFSPAVVSRSGAVGLTQLMPPTAEETARRLKMPSYRITDPADNLYIGFKYYRSMYLMYGSKLMRAMFAYNAGPTRMKRWAAAYPELPDDMMLEILEYSETRQYGRNITHAALMYGELYTGTTSTEMLDLIVEGKPLPDPALPMP